MKPYQILLCILSTIAVLAAVCGLCADRIEVVRVPSLASFMPERVEELSDTTELLSLESDTLPPAMIAVQDTQPVPPKPVQLPQALPQTKLALPLFYEALAQTGERSVRVVHFGDSQIEEDRISMILRRRLQERFGGGGVGLIPLVQTIPTYTVKQSIEQDGKPLPYTFVKRYLSYGPSAMRLKTDNVYGVMAQVAYVSEPVDVRAELLRDRVPTRDYDRIRVLYSDSVQVSLLPDSIEAKRLLVEVSDDSLKHAMLQVIIVSDTLYRSSLIRFSGEGRVFGISLETATGVQVDNIPMRGAAGTNFTLMAQEPLAAYFGATNTRLVIMQFGGNAMPSISSRSAVERYTAAMRQQIQFVMAAAPDASLLFIGPSDMITTIEGEQRSYPMLPYLDTSLKEMVEEEGGAYYSLFRLMGGAGSMFSWRDKGLAGDDMIHFTRAGAKKVGEMLAKQLLEDYDSVVESRNTKVESTDSIHD